MSLQTNEIVAGILAEFDENPTCHIEYRPPDKQGNFGIVLVGGSVPRAFQATEIMYPNDAPVQPRKLMMPVIDELRRAALARGMRIDGTKAGMFTIRME